MLTTTLVNIFRRRSNVAWLLMIAITIVREPQLELFTVNIDVFVDRDDLMSEARGVVAIILFVHLKNDTTHFVATRTRNVYMRGSRA